MRSLKPLVLVLVCASSISVPGVQDKCANEGVLYEEGQTFQSRNCSQSACGCTCTCYQGNNIACTPNQCRSDASPAMVFQRTNGTYTSCEDVKLHSKCDDSLAQYGCPVTCNAPPVPEHSAIEPSKQKTNCCDSACYYRKVYRKTCCTAACRVCQQGENPTACGAS